MNACSSHVLCLLLQELVSNVRLTAESVPGLEVSFTADCGSSATPDDTGGCTNVAIASEVSC